MAILKSKFRTTFSWDDFSQARLWTSAIIGLAVTIVFYAFLSVGFEFIRYGSFSFAYNDSVVMDPLIRRKMNLFMAGLAVLLGNSIGLVYLFRRALRRRHRRRDSQIINNQSLVLPSFIYVCFKSGFMTGALFLAAVDYELRDLFFSMVWLLGLVLYLESVKALSLHLGRQRYKILGVHFGVVILLTIGLSHMSFVDGSKMEKLYLLNHPYVEVPDVLLSDTQKERYIGNRFAMLPLKVVYQNGAALFVFGDLKFPFEQLPEVLHSGYYFQSRHERIPYVQAYVDEDIPMFDILKFEKYLSIANVPFVVYVVGEPMGRYNFRDFGVRKELPRIKEMYEVKTIKSSEVVELTMPPPPPPPLSYQWKEELQSKEIISIDVADMFRRFGSRPKPYLEYFQSKISAVVVFNFEYDQSLRFEEYLTVFVLSQRAVYELRDQERKVGKPDSEYKFSRIRSNPKSAWNLENKRLKKKYPMHFLDNYMSSS